MVPEETERGRISEKLDKLIEAMDEQQKTQSLSKQKPFKLPWKVNGAAKSLAGKNKCMVFLLRNNRTIDIRIASLINGLLVLDLEGKKHYFDGRMDCVFMYKQKNLLVPSMVLKEWDLIPIGTQDFYSTDAANSKSHPQAVVINAVEYHQALDTQKKPLNMKMILILLGVIAGAYFFATQFKKK